MVFFLIATPLKKDSMDETWKEIKGNVFEGSFGANAEGFQMDVEQQKLKLGNLDSLMHLHDNLIKLDISIEQLLKKIERQFLDIEEKQKSEFVIETRTGKHSIEQFIRNFKWDDSRFPRTNKLPDIYKGINQRMLIVDNELRQKTNIFQEAKGASTQMAKKEGNLFTKDLVDVLKEPFVAESDFVNTTYVTSLIVILQSTQINEFKKTYEHIHENVIPNSAKQLNIPIEKDGLTVWRVSVLKIPISQQKKDVEHQEGGELKKKEITPVEEFMKRARDKYKLIVKEFTFKPDESKMREEKRKELDVRAQTLTAQLKDTCVKTFSDLYITYIHLKHLRFIIDMSMRFGSYEKLLTCIIKPTTGKEKKVTQQLLKIFSDKNDIGLYGTKEELEDTEDFFPFIYIPITVGSI